MALELITYEATPVADVATVDEGLIDVYCWRMEELLRAGYHQMLAGRLAADARVDLHQACELLEQGCDGDTAFRILS
jgi:hypothetical protein